LNSTLTVYVSDPGAMTCEDIGNYAVAVVEGKENGYSYKKALATIDKNIPKGEYQIERKNLRDIVKIIYIRPAGQHLAQDTARALFEADCKGSNKRR